PLARQPGEALGGGRGGGLVLEADPPGIPGPGEVTEVALEVEGPGAGLAATGGVGDLHVRGAIDVCRDRGIEVVAVGGEVVEVEEEADVRLPRGTDVVDDGHGVGGGA